ncbi:hypothetical protein LN042_12280 [Kitasatospora sp. RB6PN24]|nr:hypothetical protein [Kitasatospora humi]MCC9307862.1 hypothetical protein [Kitasatospora humi]
MVPEATDRPALRQLTGGEPDDMAALLGKPVVMRSSPPSRGKRSTGYQI